MIGISMIAAWTLFAAAEGPGTYFVPPKGTVEMPFRTAEAFRVRDPFVLADESTKTYYLYGASNYLGETSGTAGVWVRTSKDLLKWSAPRMVMTAPRGIQCVWASEVHEYKVAYYMFATAWIGIVDLTTGALEYVNAGHNPPLLKRAGGSVEYLTAKSGPPLAAMDGIRYRRQTLSLAPGDGLVLYTDGVTEATDRDQALYGEARLVKTMRGLLGARDAEAVIGGILKDVDSFVGGTEQADDITILAFKLVGQVS